jgi:hypothetical protein
LGKKFYNSSKIGPNFFLQHFKNKIIFNKICGYKKRYDNTFFSPLSFVAVFGSEIRDPGSGMGKNQDPGSGINIPDPQPWIKWKYFSNRKHVKRVSITKGLLMGARFRYPDPKFYPPRIRIRIKISLKEK